AVSTVRLVFFFSSRRRHTSFSRDWSSDVCSSDLARRRFWEAAVSGYAVGKEGLLRIRKLYELDQSWKKQPPSTRKKKRQTILKPLVDDFFTWVQGQYLLVENERGLVRKALGYAVRQE